MEGFDYWGNKKKSSKKQTDDDEYTPYGSTSYGGGSYGGYSRGYSGGYSKGGALIEEAIRMLIGIGEPMVLYLRMRKMIRICT